MTHHVVIVGSGPAGYTAAIYCARAALKPILIEGTQVGGQLTTTTVIENWPGYQDGIDGKKLMDEMRLQAEKMGTQFYSGNVKNIKKTTSNPNKFIIEIDTNEKFESKSVIIATGASALTLPLPNKEKLMGYGLSTCAVCDGFFYRNRPVAVVGGGDSAMEEASYLAKLCSKVTLIHRREKFRASQVMQNRVFANPKIEVICNATVIDTVSNDQGLTEIVVQHKDKKVENIKVDGLFMAIGHHPNTEFIKDFVDTDEQGYILTKDGTQTNVPGIFAAGDVEDKIYRQAITAAGRGCQAALQVEKYLESLE
jgi:thioredoxin reductase (NADPH)